MIAAIAHRDLRGLFLSPVAWVLLAVNQFLLAWIFLRVVERFGEPVEQRLTGLTQELCLNLFSFAAVLSLFSVPILSMRVLSEEFRRGTFLLLGAAPLGLHQILLGKFLALLALLSLLVLLPLAMTLSLLGAAPLDLGQLAAATLGLILLNGLFAAVGVFSSSLSSHPGLAAVTCYGLLLLLSIVSQAGQTSAGHIGLFDWLSWNEHLLPFLLGLVHTGDMLYFALLTAFFLLLAQRQLTNRRLG